MAFHDAMKTMLGGDMQQERERIERKNCIYGKENEWFFGKAGEKKCEWWGQEKIAVSIAKLGKMLSVTEYEDDKELNWNKSQKRGMGKEEMYEKRIRKWGFCDKSEVVNYEKGSEE